MLPSGGRRSLQESGEALGGVTTVGLPPRGAQRGHTGDRQPIRQSCRPRQHGTNGGFAPRDYNATHIWASTITAGTLLPKRAVYPPRLSPAINPGGLLVGEVNHSSFTKSIVRQCNSS